MTDAEIIKAFKCCCAAKLKEDCQKLKCPFFDNEIYNCMNVDDENAMYRYALDLINRQKEKIERLRAESGNQSTLWSQHYESLFETAKETIKVEAIKEFAERLKTDYGEFVYLGDIDNLVKEMTGDMK